MSAATPEPEISDVERRHWEFEQMRQAVTESVARQRQLNAEADKLLRETAWYPVAAGSAATLAIVAIVKLFL